MSLHKRRLAFIAGMIISAAFLFLAFRGLQPDQFWNSLSEVDLPLLIFAALFYCLAVIIIALRWQYLLRAVKLVPLPALTQIVFIGYMGNNVYPLRAGDALRIALLRRNHAVPLVRATTVVIIERLFDGCVMLAFILFGLLFIDLQSEPIKTIVALTAPLFTVAVLLAFFLAAKPNLLRGIVDLVIKALPQRAGSAIARLSEDVIAGLEGLRSPVNLLGAVVSSFVTWGVEAGAYWIVIFAFGLELNYAVALLLVGAVNLAGLIPASPGQVGVNEFVVITILTALGLPTASASAYAVVTHLVIWLPPTILGFTLLLRMGMGWSDIRSAGESESPAPLANDV
ncbi:MAG: lysylphosphatidylglycerol synthase transmembrane domain-containing protein [Chloroflexi bacterium]|nr:lysylphosphatidylglycerol synthase transmembrane domain-containing protein [Chloroflexota bacterium]